MRRTKTAGGSTARANETGSVAPGRTGTLPPSAKFAAKPGQ
jgi:hypothetical protein